MGSMAIYTLDEHSGGKKPFIYFYRLDILGIPSFVAYNDKEESGRFVSKLRKTKEEIQAFIDTLK